MRQFSITVSNRNGQPPQGATPKTGLQLFLAYDGGASEVLTVADVAVGALATHQLTITGDEIVAAELFWAEGGAGHKVFRAVAYSAPKAATYTALFVLWEATPIGGEVYERVGGGLEP